MGKKTHPAAIRIDFSGWKNAVWYSPTKQGYIDGIKNDHIIRTNVVKFFEIGLIANVVVERTAGNTVAFIHTHRPGAVIGEKGINLEKLQNLLKNKFDIIVKFNIVEVYRPEANAQLICDQIVKQLINRGDYKKAIKTAIKFASKSPIVKGICVIIGGRLNGAAIARTERFQHGSVSRQTFRDKIIYCKGAAKTIYGICGVKVLMSYHPASHGVINNNFRDNNRNNDRRPNNDRNGGRFEGKRNFSPRPPRSNFVKNETPKEEVKDVNVS